MSVPYAYEWKVWPVIEDGKRGWRLLVYTADGKLRTGKRSSLRKAERKAKGIAQSLRREDELNARHLAHRRCPQSAPSDPGEGEVDGG